MEPEARTATWSQHDTAVWTTCEIASALLANDPDRLPSLAAAFPPHLAGSELLLASGGFALMTHRAIGDGTYVRADGSTVATGRAGVVLTVGAAAARAAGNRRRRAQAQADAVPRWVLDDQGSLWVSTAGFYLETVQGLFPWGWDAIRSCRLVAPGSVHLQGEGDNGPVSWILRSDWAELVFVLWAMARHPNHPDLSGGRWLPPGWVERCRAAGLAPAHGADALAPRDGSH